MRNVQLAAALGAMLVGPWGCGDRPGAPASEPEPPRATPAAWFEPAGPDSGLDFVHRRALETRYWFPEIMSGGAAWLDYDLDGDLDAYLVQGGDLRDGGGVNRLYRNDGGRFVDATQTAGVGDAGYGMGAIVGDLDNDGDPDLYVTNVGPDALYRNRGDGTFEGVELPHDSGSWGASGAAWDYDRDGDLDLYIVNYVTWSPAVETECYGVGGSRDYCHPSRYQAPAADTLLRNEGSWRFTDVSEETGLVRAFGNGLGAALVDLTGPDTLDLYVANDGMPNQLWTWDGRKLSDSAVPRGCSVSGLGVAEAGMGVAPGDVDGDGRFDLLLTHLARETNTLYLNRAGLCHDATGPSGLAAPSLPRTGFGTAFADFDHDGELDLWVSNGRVGLEEIGGPEDPFAEPDQLFRGLGSARFELLDPAASGVGRRPDNSRGAAFGDYDGDGDIDALVVENGGPAKLHRNRTDGSGWIRLHLVAPGGTEAIGARVSATTENTRRWRLAQRAYSYCASHDPSVHFGVGEASTVDELRVIEASGRQIALRDLPVARVYRLGL